MIIVIDGYNLLKHIHGKLSIDEAKREDYLKILQRYAQKKKHEIVMVFDGGVLPRPLYEAYGPIKVVFSGYQQSADDVIKTYLEEHAQKDVVLVTADRELINYAASLRIFSLKPLLFNEYVQAISQKDKIPIILESSDIYKTKHEENQELDTLMIQASEKIIQKIDDKDNKVEAHKKTTTSKKERAIDAILKKL